MTGMRRAGAGLAGLVLVVTVLVVAGVGQGAPPHTPSISAAAKRREIAAVQTGGAEVQLGKRLFYAHGCSNCHTMAAGSYDGRLGPRLDVQSQGNSVNAVIKNIEQPPDDDKGYEPGLMPQNFGARLSRSDLRALATYINVAATAAQGKGGGH